MKGLSSYLATTALAGLAAGGVASAAHAQSAPPSAVNTTAPAADTGDQEIVVTGSRISSPTVTSPSPLQVIDQQAIKHEAFINVIDAIQQNPAFGNPGNSRTQSNGSRTGTGVSSIGLRNGGPNLTLVLVEGRRVVPGLPGSSAVDVGFIPTGFIDRVEILTGGASAVYGSDAVAGVVNFIYKKNYSGIQANAQYGISQRGDDGERQADITIGHNFADGKGNAMFYFGWSKQDVVFNSARSFASSGLSSLGTQERSSAHTDANLQAAKDLFVPYANFSTISPAGQFTAGGKNFTVNADGTGRPIDKTLDAYNGAPYAALASPLERFNFATRAHYDVSSLVSLYVEGNYGRTKTEAYSGPLALVTSGGLGVFRATKGFYDIESFVTQADGSTIKVRNPLVPDAIYDAATDTDGDGLKDISASRRMSEYGHFHSVTNRNQFQFTVGAQGDLGHSWKYDAFYSYGETNANQVTYGLYNQDRMADALEVVPDINDVNHNGSTTDPICASAEARAQGCVPADIYGANKMSAAAVSYTQAKALRNARQSLENAGINLTGSLFNLPYGTVQAAVGVEYRREASSEMFDPLANAGRNGYAQQTDTAGSFNVKEAYGELQVPLLAHLPFAENLTVRGAVRASDYSSLRKTFLAYSGAIEWAPIRDIRFRGTYSHATRAPNISELYRPAQTTIDNVVDPCKGVTTTTPGAGAARCRADPAILANMNAHNGVFTLNSQDQSGVTTFTAPNPNLHEQTASTWTFGAVLNPVSIPALRNFTFTADYYRLNIDNGIGGESVTAAADLCYNQGQQFYCDAIQRRTSDTGVYSTGSIEFYSSQLSNNDSQRLDEGLDFSLSYLTKLAGGDLNVTVSYSHLLRAFTRDTATAAPRNRKAELGTLSDPATASLSWDNDRFGFTVTGQYISPSFADQPTRAGFILADGTPVPKDYFRIPPYLYTDIQLRAKVANEYQLFFGVKNLTDTQPPIGGYIGSAGFGTGYVYDPFGRRFYAGVRLNL
jgi:outer membrane receptor protein involved in Fe transport